MESTTETAMPSLETFDPTEATLKELVATTAHIIEVNLDDPEQIASVKRARLNLRTARVQLEKTGKSMRDGANAYAKAVIAREKELINIITPEEERLAEFEKQSAELAEKRIREQQLPERKARLEAERLPAISDEVLLTMTSLQFEHNINDLIAERNRADSERIEEEQAAKQAELDGRENAIKAEEKRIADEAAAKKREEDAAAQAVLDEQQRVQREADAKAAAEEEEKKKLEAQASWNAFLQEHGWTKDSQNEFKVERLGNGEAVLWKRVANYSNPNSTK